LATRLRNREGEGRATQYDFSDLRDASPSTVAFRYLDKNWRIVPLDHSGEPVAVDEAEESAIVPSWVEDPNVRVGIATGRNSGIVALWFRRKLITRTRRALAKHPHPPTLENDGIDGYYVIFRAPKEDLSSLEIDEGAYFLGEGGAIVPAHHRWSTACVELAPLPDSLRRLALGEPPPSTKERIAAGDFAAANRASRYEAAQGYDALGLKLLPVADYNTRLAVPKGTEGVFVPELWEKHPTKGIGIMTGVRSGVVGLLFANHGLLNQWRSKYGQLSSTMIDGRHPILCFRAPAEEIPFQEMEGVAYLGEGGFFPAPPSTVEGRRLEWELGSPPQSLPEVPQWLRDQLGQRQYPDVAACAPRANSAKSVAKAGKAVPDLRKFALSYADRGLQVFPLKPNSAEPLFPKRASDQATTDPETISRWWGKTPLANIGVRTGGASGVAVLVANTQSGVRSLADLERLHGAIQTPRAQDQSGRLLLVFDCPESGVESCTGLLPGLAFHGNGSFAVLPPSRVEGREYRWVDPAQKGKAKVPGWLLDLVAEQVQKRTSGPTSSSAASDFVDGRFDRLDAWLEARCEKGEGFSEKASVLLADFSAWSSETVSEQLFGRLLREKGFPKKKSSVWWYLGLRLKASST
jgi:hypothetical protein